VSLLLIDLLLLRVLMHLMLVGVAGSFALMIGSSASFLSVLGIGRIHCFSLQVQAQIVLVGAAV